MHSLMKSGIRILESKDSMLLQKKFKKQTLITLRVNSFDQSYIRIFTM